MIRLAALAAMALVLGSPAHAETPDAEIKRIEIERMTFGTGITVIHDDKRDVTCWVFRDQSAGSSGGMSCIPDWMITRGERAPIGFAPEMRP